MALGANQKAEPLAAQWVLPQIGVLQGVNDISIPPNALYSCLNIQIVDGTLRGRTGLTAHTTQLFGATPKGALNFFQNGSASWVVLGTTNKVWTLELSTGTWTDRGGSLTGTIDDPVRVLQFAFGTPLTNRAYIANGVDVMKVWKPSEATVNSVIDLGPEKVTNGFFTTSDDWIFGTNWAHDSTNKEADHTTGATADLEQDVSAVNGETYRVVFTVKNRTAGSVTPSVGGVSGTAVSSNDSFEQDITATGTGNLKFTPTTDFDGSIDSVSVKKHTEDAPTFRDMTVIGDRIVGLIGSHEVGWGDQLSDTNWPLLNRKVFGETPSPTTAIRMLGNIGVVVYKRDSIWLGELTGLPDAQALRWSFIDSVEGPANPNALVEAGGRHIYMTRDGRVGFYAGFNHEWIADGAWPVVRAEIDDTKPNQVWGVYKPKTEEVWFSYKRTGQSTIDGLLIVKLANKRLQRPYAAFTGRWGKSVTAGCTSWDDAFPEPFGFTNDTSAEKTYKFEGSDDAGTAYNAHIQTGLVLPKSTQNLDNVRILPVEPFLERLAGYGTLTVKAVTSNVLDSISGTLSPGKTVDLTQTPIKEVVGLEARGRYVGLRLEWTSAATVRYRGAVLRADQGK